MSRGAQGPCPSAHRPGTRTLCQIAPLADYAWYPETVTAALPSVRYVDGAGEAHASDHVGPEPWPPPEWVIAFENAFLGDVDDDGALTWPVAEAIAANNPADSHPEADADTLHALRDAATEDRTVDVSLE